MSDWDSGDDAPVAPKPRMQPRYDQNSEYGNDRKPNRFANDRRDYGNDRRDYGNDRRDYGNDRRGYGNDRRGSGGGNEQRNSYEQNGQRRDDQSNYGNGRRDQDRYGGNDFKMEVDNSKVGMIIGKGGSKIREIQDSHNVNVKIGKCGGKEYH